ncbi:Gfo/Idh/MocA family protein [Sphingomonas sp. MMS24-J13]|uniref:Gfo/Idh/MocA family protein n=1 Tax=Sphingomonas sp. MMS24-J13 TaxID=3238686 RepID=UPI00384F084D
MSQNPLKIGIIGAGRMGVTHHCIINSRPDVDVVAIADPSIMMNMLLGKYAGVKTHKDYKGLLDGEQVDAVLVCTPPKANYEILQAVRARNVHTFVEKPFTLSATQGADLAQQFEDAGLVNQVGYVNRFNDVFVKVREMVADGVVGRLLRFRSEMYSSTIIREQGDEGWRSTHENGGGAIYEMASHAVDLINFLFGKPDLVTGTSLTSVFSKAVEDIVSSSFLYRNGVSGSLYVNWSDASYRKPTNKLELFGDAGKIQADQHGMKVFLSSPNAKYGLQAGWNQLYITDLFSNVPFYLRGIEFTAQLYDFVDCIQAGGRRARCTFQDATDTLSIIDAMFADWQRTQSELQA